jgi:hypothetical protein
MPSNSNTNSRNKLNGPIAALYLLLVSDFGYLGYDGLKNESIVSVEVYITFQYSEKRRSQPNAKKQYT